MKQLFMCTRCDHVDLVDLAASETMAVGQPVVPFICTQCATGQWHAQFPYLRYDPETDAVINPPIDVP